MNTINPRFKKYIKIKNKIKKTILYNVDHYYGLKLIRFPNYLKLIK